MQDIHKALFAVLDEHRSGITDITMTKLTQELVLLVDQITTDWHA